MSTVRENDIGDDAVMIPELMLNEFKFGTGFISSARYSSFERLLIRKSGTENDVSMHGFIPFGAPPHD